MCQIFFFLHKIESKYNSNNCVNVKSLLMTKFSLLKYKFKNVLNEILFFFERNITKGLPYQTSRSPIINQEDGDRKYRKVKNGPGRKINPFFR